jgi:uncharacterized protein YcbK (DUF882 family)
VCLSDKLTDHFKRSEFECQCKCGADNISQELVARLEIVRIAYGKSMRINSGLRCPTHNRSVGASSTSNHLPHTEEQIGYAADIAVSGGQDRHKLVELLMAQFQRLGVAKNFIHVDIHPEKPAPALWCY